MTKCSVCGREMQEHRSEDEQVYAVQMCCLNCVAEAWRNVTDALKTGQCAEWYDRHTERTVKLSETEKKEILRLHKQGMPVADIARKINRGYTTVRRIVKHSEI